MWVFLNLYSILPKPEYSVREADTDKHISLNATVFPVVPITACMFCSGFKSQLVRPDALAQFGDILAAH